MYNRLHLIPACDRQTDGRTDILLRHSPRYAYASRFSYPKKNCMERYWNEIHKLLIANRQPLYLMVICCRFASMCIDVYFCCYVCYVYDNCSFDRMMFGIKSTSCESTFRRPTDQLPRQTRNLTIHRTSHKLSGQMYDIQRKPGISWKIRSLYCICYCFYILQNVNCCRQCLIFTEQLQICWH